MLTPGADRIQRALERLQPGTRALLELSARPDMSDRQIAELLRVDFDEVGRRRERALRRLAGELGVDPDDQLGARLAEHLTGDREPEPEPPPQRKRGRPWAAAAVLLIGAIIGAVVAATGGDDEGGKKKRAAGPAEPPARPTRVVSFTALPGSGGARGSARLRDGRLRLRVNGLPPPQGSYEVWLYSSIDRAAPIRSFHSGTFSMVGRLPDDLNRYRFVDVSREPNDGNPNHSGASLLRLRTDRLR